MAKAALEGAVWDLYAKQITNRYHKLWRMKNKIEVGISLVLKTGIMLNYWETSKAKVNEGYKRIKIKIKPGKDIEVVREVRKYFPSIPLMVDANSAYTLRDIDVLKALDEFDLMMIEQPLAAGNLIDHAKLQKEIKTPVCLDESIHLLEQ